LTDVAVAKAVGITPKQKGQIEEIGQEMRDAMRAQATGQGGGRVRGREIRDQANKKIEALLTAPQRARWEKLQGKKFASTFRR
jgi:Spy/CpxP family protein refolding chaperone